MGQAATGPVVRPAFAATPGRRGRWSCLRLALLGLLLAGCGLVSATTPVTRPIVTADGELRQIEERPPAGSPAIDEATARRQAAPYVAGAPQATAVQARFVALTLATDRQAWNFQARPVWLVTYAGVPFMPEGCACHTPPTANTVVALDGHTGELVLVYGSDSA